MQQDDKELWEQVTEGKLIYPEEVEERILKNIIPAGVRVTQMTPSPI